MCIRDRCIGVKPFWSAYFDFITDLKLTNHLGNVTLFIRLDQQFEKPNGVTVQRGRGIGPHNFLAILQRPLNGDVLPNWQSQNVCVLWKPESINCCVVC